MMEVQHGQPQSFHGAAGVTNIRDVNVTTINDNKMWVGRSMSRSSPSYCSYEPSPRSERNGRCIEMVSKAPHNTSWWNDHDMKRKRRVAKYKLYAAESKLKCSLKKGFRSFKITCMKIVYNL